MKSKKKSRIENLVKNTLIISLGTFLPQLTSLITLPILTLKLSSAEYGYYDLIGTLISLLIPIITLQIQAAGFRFILSSKDDKIQCTKYISNIFFVVTISSFFSTIILYFVFYKLSNWIKICILMYFVLDTYTNALIQIVRGFSKNKIYSIGAIIQSLVKTIVLYILLINANLGLLGSIIALILGNVVAFIFEFCAIKLWQYLSFKQISKNIIKEMLKYSWPMVPNTLSGWILRVSDRIVITSFLGIEQNAIYAIANKIPNLLGVLNSTFTMAWQENASINANDNDIEFYYTSMFNMFIKFLAGGTAILISFTPIMFIILINGNYKLAYYQMPILFIGIFYSCISSFLGGIYIANKRTKNVGITTIIAAVINLVVDLILISYIGITAGSISTLVSYIILVLYRMYDLRKYQNINYDLKAFLFVNLYLIVMSIIFFFNNTMLNILNVMIGLSFAIIINKDIIQKIIEKIKERSGANDNKKNS